MTKKVYLIIILSSLALTASAQMYGSVYKIESDSINSGGAETVSGSYGLDDTTGEQATGDSASTNFAISAGYRQMENSFISLSVSNNVVMLPELGGLTGGTSLGSTTVQVITDNPAGYSLLVQSSSSPTLRTTDDAINDYTPVAANPDFDFLYGPGQSFFGFSPEGGDISDAYRDYGNICGVIGGNDTTNQCWDGLATSTKTVARGGANQPGGMTTIIKFKAGIGPNRVQIEGDYTGTTTLTVIAM